MNEFGVEKCYCEVGYMKGAIKKNCEFENFSIFGNLMQKNTIVIRYNGILAKSNSDKITLYYVFNNDWTNKKEITLTTCEHEKGAFCASIDLEDYLNITFGFYNNSGTYDMNLANSYSLKIATNTIDDIMKRYSLEPNESLPISQENSTKLHTFSSIINGIKNIFKNIFKKQVQD